MDYGTNPSSLSRVVEDSGIFFPVIKHIHTRCDTERGIHGSSFGIDLTVTLLRPLLRHMLCVA